jgi:hypothetical protein
MSTIFPGSASVGQIFEGYSFNGTAWDLIGNEFNPTYFSPTPPDNTKAGDLWVDSSSDVPSISPENILTTSSASATYLTQSNASSTYATKANFPEGDWTSYTPTLTNVTLGTGGASSFWWNKIGKVVFVKGNIVLGSSGFSIGGSVSFSLPVTSAAQAAYPLGIANYADGGTLFEGIVRYTSSTSAAFAAISSGGTYTSYSNLSSTVPFTWGAADAIRFQMMYEAA